jgi:hypothetical protein
MPTYRLRIIGAVLMSAAIAAGTVQDARAQRRFVFVGSEPQLAVPGLEIVTLRDTVQDACYLLFVMKGPAAVPQAPSLALDAAKAERDRKLAGLAGQFDRAQYTPAPGVPQASPLRYEWEAQKAQSDYERVLLDYHFKQLEDSIAQVAAGARLAVTGPAPCSAPAKTPDR